MGQLIFWNVFISAGLYILVLMTALWVLSLILKNTSIVDICWGAGFVMVTWVAFGLTPDSISARKWLIVLLVSLWGLRLTIHILLRNWGKGEDFRYAKWRQEHGSKWWWYSFFQTFLLQGVLMWVISTPLIAAQIHPTPTNLTILDVLGIIVWTIGFFFEAVGDYQLARFKKSSDNKGKLLNTGVWRFTRHPNYFGDAAQWWGFYLIATAAGGWWTIFSPILMTLFLLRVSGVTLLESTLKETKPGYRDYISTTSPFIPWFPRRKKNL
jgi:steroid 5-alpha reductase family enzyme